MKNNISEQFSINFRERVKAIVLGCLGAVAGYVTNLTAQPDFDFLHAFNDWHTLVNGAVTAASVYLVATFFAKPPKTE